MKKAFTLIELLVVIAIIAILAAILFPVFAQAKLAAKKTVSISNQKQISLAIIMYAGDYDDMYPHNDGCTLNDSVLTYWNTLAAGSDPTAYCNGIGVGNGLGGYAFRDNHYGWQKWVLPYVKSLGLFQHPTIALIKGTDYTGSAAHGNEVPNGFDQGEMASGYALNIAITGAQNTWPTPAIAAPYGGAIRDSFVGGTQTGIASPAQALLTTEQAFEVVTGGWETNYAAPVETPYWPIAMKEHWEFMFLKGGGTGDCGTQPGVVDTTKVPFGVVPVGFADGHVKAMNPGAIIAGSPTFTQYVSGSSTYSTSMCGYFAAYGNNSYTSSLIGAGSGQYPLWGL